MLIKKIQCLYIKMFSFLWQHFFSTNGKQLIDKKIFNKIYNYRNAIVFKKKYLRVIKHSEQYLLEIYKENENEFFKKFKEIKNGETVYLYALYGAGGDYACAYIFIKDVILYLQSKDCKIILVGNEKLRDIIGLYRFNDVELRYAKFYMYGINEDCAKLLIKDDISLNNSRLICINFPLYGDLFLKNPKKYGGIKYYYNLSETFRKKFGIKKEILPYQKYVYDNINKSKIDDIIKNYNNKKGLIVCNFENKSFRAYKDDEIKFSDYINNLNDISKELHIKFIVNSVYNNENLFKNENVLITRLNRQEIVRLIEHDKINLFISERNGLNDVFYVFYPNIKQIVFYPNCYYTGVCIDKYLYKDIHMYDLKTDALNAHYLFGRSNIVQDYRKHYFQTIAEYIKNFN